MWEVLKVLLHEHVTVEDEEIHIKDKKRFAYTVFNLVYQYDREWVEDMLAKKEYPKDTKWLAELLEDY